MSTIEQILDHVVAVEGGYVNNPDDKGGATNWGITERVARANGFTGDMRLMTRQHALDIYRREYVAKPGFDKIHVLNNKIAAELIDTGINCGTSVACIFLQRCLNALNAKASLYPDIKVDGDIGPGTIGAFKMYLAKHGARAEKLMLRALNCLQGARYIEISEGRGANETFLAGWLMNRVEV